MLCNLVSTIKMKITSPEFQTSHNSLVIGIAVILFRYSLRERLLESRNFDLLIKTKQLSQCKPKSKPQKSNTNNLALKSLDPEYKI